MSNGLTLIGITAVVAVIILTFSNDMVLRVVVSFAVFAVVFYYIFKELLSGNHLALGDEITTKQPPRRE